MHVIAEITYTCPANCYFCPIKKENFSRTLMPVSDFQKALKLFKDYFKDSKRYLLTISGGEPTTLQSLPKYVKVAKELGYKVTIASNCYNPEILLESKPDFVQISLDAINTKHNMSRKLELWHKVLKVLEWIKEGKLKGFIRYTLMNDNFSDLLSLRTRLDALGLKNIKILAMPVRGCPELAPSKEIILDVIKTGVATLPTRCPAGKGQFVITPDLRVLDCIFHRQELGELGAFSPEELSKIIENGRKLEHYPCGEPYWWAMGEDDDS